MRVMLAFALLVGLIAGGARAEGCKLAPMARLPVQDNGQHLWVQAVFNGVATDMLFDTGAFTTVITPQAAARADLRVMTGEEIQNGANTVIRGIGGGRPAIAMTAHTMDLGGLKARNYNILSADMGFHGAGGVLSVDLIANYDVDLDLAEQRINLFKPLGDCSHPAAFLEGPLYSLPLRPTGRDARPRIVVQIGGQDVVALVDTGASHSLIYRQAAERLGLNAHGALAASTHKTRGIGPEAVSAAFVSVPEVDVGDLSFNNMKLDILDDHAIDEVEMLLGADFLHKVHLWISYSSHTLIMQFPPKATKPTQ